MSDKTIAVVIATYERQAPLTRLLASLSLQTLPTSLWEVVVVVDGGKDQSATYLAAETQRGVLPLSFAVQTNAGPAAARHRGISMCSADRVVLVDDDMEVGPEFLAAHLRAAASAPNTSVVLGRIIAPSDWQSRPLHDALGELGMMELHQRFAAGVTQPSSTSFVSGNVSLPRALYGAVGGFDLSFRIDEDRELGYRLEKGGASYYFSADAWSVHHSDLGAFDRWLRRQAAYGGTALRVYEKHARDPNLHPLRNYLLGSALNRWLVTLVCPFPPLARATVTVLRGLGQLLQHTPAWRLAIATHKAIAAIQFHLCLSQAYGSWKNFRLEAQKLRLDPLRPLRPTNK